MNDGISMLLWKARQDLFFEHDRLSYWRKTDSQELRFYERRYCCALDRVWELQQMCEVTL
jgi:hypothetical protein